MRVSSGSGRSAALPHSVIESSQGFGPVCAPNARVLVLGSLPGVRSLQQTQYYAQPRNAFWKIMGELCGASPQLPYAVRLQMLVRARIALWDVVAAAQRPGSLDSSIRRASVEVNDFAGFFAAHPQIELICFNGRTAADLFTRRVAPLLRSAAPPTVVLPSTSPAHAGMPYAEKLRRWREQLDFVTRES